MPRLAWPEVLFGVQELIIELVSRGRRLVSANISLKRLEPDSKDRVGRFRVSASASEDEYGPELRFCCHVPVKHRQTNNGVVLWEDLETL